MFLLYDIYVVKYENILIKYMSISLSVCLSVCMSQLFYNFMKIYTPPKRFGPPTNLILFQLFGIQTQKY